MRALVLACGLSAQTAAADVLVPLRTIRAREVIAPGDITVKLADVPGTLTHPDQAVGQEARVALYPGRPLRSGDIGPPALIDRNQIVSLIFAQGGLRITTEGRSLDRASAGETIRVMNLSSRSTVTGFVRADGIIEVR
ncbi:flagellar basal body P-ring formation chaperone FlgA [Albibacillus kandeliae]|uniref:flagellar basal body P-ring formation chaperone FlgA n=1 Tax=Albibacillus kandeliae TaxID=2174228 RepID=UPI000D69FFFB|nr:flagellar basal body P-ring formation chaperone FlgA [Albibacillus kandeliae]